MGDITVLHDMVTYFPVPVKTGHSLRIDAFWWQDVSPVVAQQLGKPGLVLLRDSQRKGVSRFFWRMKRLLCHRKRGQEQQG